MSMGELASDAGRKLIAVGVLLVAAYILFKIVIGFVMGIVWIAMVVIALIAVVWAVRTL